MELRNWQLLLLTAVIICGCAGGILFLRSWANPGYVPEPFVQQIWAEGDAERRGTMAKSLLEKHDIVGMGKGQIVELLGKPDEDQTDLNRFRYYLGHMGRNPKATFLTEFSLLIEFGPDGKATDASIAD